MRSAVSIKTPLPGSLGLGFRRRLEALVVALIAGFWFRNENIGLIIGAALVINLVCAALAGLSIPFMLKRMNIDPAHAGTVLLTTITDVVGFLVFLGLGTLFLL